MSISSAGFKDVQKWGSSRVFQFGLCAQIIVRTHAAPALVSIERFSTATDCTHSSVANTLVRHFALHDAGSSWSHSACLCLFLLLLSRSAFYQNALSQLWYFCVLVCCCCCCPGMNVHNIKLIAITWCSRTTCVVLRKRNCKVGTFKVCLCGGVRVASFAEVKVTASFAAQFTTAPHSTALSDIYEKSRSNLWRSNRLSSISSNTHSNRQNKKLLELQDSFEN